MQRCFQNECKTWVELIKDVLFFCVFCISLNSHNASLAFRMSEFLYVDILTVFTL